MRIKYEESIFVDSTTRSLRLTKPVDIQSTRVIIINNNRITQSTNAQYVLVRKDIVTDKQWEKLRTKVGTHMILDVPDGILDIDSHGVVVLNKIRFQTIKTK